MPDISLPDVINTEDELDEVLTRPSPVLVDFIRTVQGPLVILGAGGKMGPTLAWQATRAAQAAGHELDVFAVSRFSDGPEQPWLAAHGVRTLRLDLLNHEALKQLPDASEVIYLVG